MFGLRSNLRVGIDLGSHSIKAVVVEKVGPRFRLLKWNSVELYTGGEKYDPEGPKKSVLVPKLMKVVTDMGLNPRRIKRLATCIGGGTVAAKEISSLMQTEEEMNSNLLLEARKHIPLDGSDTVVDYQLLGDNPAEPEKVRVLLVATTRKQYEGHQDYLRELDIKPGVIDVEPLAVINSYLSQASLPENGVIVFLHVGAKKSILSVFGSKDLFFTRDLSVAGQAFTQELMAKYGLSYEDAEKVKIEQGMNPTLEVSVHTEEGSLGLADKSALEKLGDEINRSLRYYVKESGQSIFTHIVLTGGGALLKDMDVYLNNKFNLPVEIYNPLNQLDSRVPVDVPNPAQFSAAVGLAIRGDL